MTDEQIKQKAEEYANARKYTLDELDNSILTVDEIIRLAFIAGAEWASQVCEKGWIETSKAMPALNDRVLAMIASSSPSVMRYNGRSFIHSISMTTKMRDGSSAEIKYDQVFNCITHWMPIPKLKEGE